MGEVIDLNSRRSPPDVWMQMRAILAEGEDDFRKAIKRLRNSRAARAREKLNENPAGCDCGCSCAASVLGFSGIPEQGLFSRCAGYIRSMGSVQNVVPMLFAVAAGVSFVVQQAVSSRLRSTVGSPWWAGFVSYAGGTLVMAIAILLLRERWVSTAQIIAAPWWAWTGGVFGAIYIVASIVLLPRLGTATVVALIVVGQMAGSLIFDNFGAFGVPRVPIDLSRVIAAGFLIAGVVLIRR